MLLLFVPQALQAHPAPFSYLDLQLSQDRIEGSVTVHVIDLAHELEMDEPASLLDEGVLSVQYSRIGTMFDRQLELGGGELPGFDWQGVEPLPQDDAVRIDFTIAAPPPAALEVSARLFSYDPAHQTFVNIYEGGELRQQWIMAQGSAPQTYYAGTAAGVLAVLGTFIPAGVEHILIGPDHILFLFALLLLGGSFRRLVVIVTSFTIGHSITLVLATLGLAMVPAAVIEPLIALSIVVVAADNLLRGPDPANSRDLRWGMALVFGLIHGFGFAYVLRAFGLPDAALGWSLFAFNLGVEIGQLLLVVPLALALHWLHRSSAARARQIATIGSVAVIAAGAYWFVERVFLTGAG